MPEVCSNQHFILSGGRVTTNANIVYPQLTPLESGGKVRVRYAEYIQRDSPGHVGQEIYLTRLPNKATILPGSKVFFSAHGSRASIKVGIPGEPGKLLGATSTERAGSADLTAHLFGGAAPWTAPAETDIIATNDGSAIPVNGKITVFILYVTD